jgi:hypothetical protein
VSQQTKEAIYFYISIYQGKFLDVNGIFTFFVILNISRSDVEMTEHSR